jgi:FtsZ-binding cell division protein ZapB
LIDKLQEEKNELTKKFSKISKQQEALKSRTHILEKEKQDFKTKLQVFHDKSKNDDALIEALQRQLNVLLPTNNNKNNNNKVLPRVRTAESNHPTNAMEMERMQQLIQDQKRQLVHQEKTIESYKYELEKIQQLNSKIFSFSSGSGNSNDTTGINTSNVNTTFTGITTTTTTNNSDYYRMLAMEKEKLNEKIKVQQQQIEELQKKQKQEVITTTGTFSVSFYNN